MHRAEPLPPERSPFEVEIAMEELKRYKSQGSNQIPAELIQAGGIRLSSEIQKTVNSIWDKEELSQQW
jgi:translation initiation factor 2B subunit (eIF-2B alpha/beta/delta family)